MQKERKKENKQKSENSSSKCLRNPREENHEILDTRLGYKYAR